MPKFFYCTTIIFMLELERIQNKHTIKNVYFNYAIKTIWRDVRVAEGARLESGYGGNSIRGSNPLLSAITVLDGESAVPCNLQSAIAGSNS